jgi:hypothetical protein
MPQEITDAVPTPPIVAVDSRASERSIPIRSTDLTRRLQADPKLGHAERHLLGQFGRLLRAIYHEQFHGWLLELKDLYAPLDPDSDCVDLAGGSRARDEGVDEAFLKAFEAALVRANYRPLELAVLERAIEAPNEMGLNYVPNFELFEHLKVYVRGRTKVTRYVRNVATRFKRKPVVLDGYRRLVIALKFRSDRKIGPLVSADRLYLRMFKDVPHVDMEMHLPEQGTRVRMRAIDKAQIASPLVVGLPTFAFKLLTASLISPFAVGAVLSAPITAGLNSFFGFQRAKQKHLHHMIRSLYYLTVANNAAVIHTLIDSAEEEEYKEALLAYATLLKHREDPEPWDQERLDRHVEQALQEYTGQPIDFEVRDAVGKLLRLGLVHESPQGFLSATRLGQALAVLDAQWDDLFRYREDRGKARAGGPGARG